jgi:hypothetical protein
MSQTFIGRGGARPNRSRAPGEKEPRLYERYGAHEAVAFFGPLAAAESLCNGQWLIFPSTVVCLASIGEAPRLSHFATGSQFFWVADQAYRVNDEPYTGFVPAQVVGPKGTERSIRLFVRPQESEPYVYVGELEPSYMQQAPGPQGHGSARFELKPALPSDVWRQLGGPAPGDLDFAPVDRALDRLRGPTSVEQRFEILQQLVEYWHGPIRPEDGMSDAELAGWSLPLPLPPGVTLPLPLPLLWWYRWAGKREEIMSGQNFLFKPGDEERGYRQLEIRDGCLSFYIENQGVYEWATLPKGDDPPVFGRLECKGPWKQEAVTLSEHLIQVCLFEAVTCHAKYGAWKMGLEAEVFAEIIKTIPPLAIGSSRWPERYQFYSGRGAFMYAAEFDEKPGRSKCYSMFIGAKTEHPLQFLKPYIDDGWEHVAI